MWPILLTSLAGLTVFFVKVWEFRQQAVLPRTFVRRYRHFMEHGDIQQAAAESAANTSSLAIILQAGFHSLHRGRSERREILQAAGQSEISRLSRWTSVIAVVATVGPLLGLLGTVTGMLTVFMDISQFDNPHIAILARGIYEALITTAVGLPVGILGYVLHAWTSGRLDRISHALGEEAEWFLNAFPKDKEDGIQEEPVEFS